MVKQGEVPALKIGGRWKFNRGAVEEQLARMAANSWMTGPVVEGPGVDLP